MDPGLDPPEVAELLFGAVPLTGGTRPADWSTLWSVVGDRLDDFLSALERKAGADGLARRVRESLERLTAAHGESAQTPTVVRPLW